MLFNLFMNGHTLKNWIVLLKFDTLSCVFLIFSGDVTGSSRLSTFLVLGALKDNLYSIAFFCHLTKVIMVMLKCLFPLLLSGRH